MELGQFSLSLPVKDMEKSLAFYETLGFEVIDGGHAREEMPDTDETAWRILSRKEVVIGLFKGMFDFTILTFNPTDVRAIQKHLKANNIALEQEADESTTGPAFITLADPDGNHIMFDQH